MTAIRSGIPTPSPAPSPIVVSEQLFELAASNAEDAGTAVTVVGTDVVTVMGTDVVTVMETVTAAEEGAKEAATAVGMLRYTEWEPSLSSST